MIRPERLTLKAQEARPEPEDNRLLDATTVDLMRQWRVIHMPLNAVFMALALVHILSVVVLRDW